MASNHGIRSVDIDEKIQHLNEQLYDTEALIGLGYASYNPALLAARLLLQRVNILAQRMEQLDGRPTEGLYRRVFGSENPKATGAVGSDAATIHSIVQGNGNLRETMITIYAAAKHYNPELGSTHVYHYMERIASIHQEHFHGNLASTQSWLKEQNLDFVNLKFILEKQQVEQKSGALTLGTKDNPTFLPFGAPQVGGAVFEARTRNDIKAINENRGNPFFVDQVLPPLGQYEAQFHQQHFPNDPQLRWLPGGGKHGRWKLKEYNVSANDDYTTNEVMKVPTQYGLLTLCGPSGTTTRFILVAKYLGFTPPELEMLKFTLIGWMVPSQDHTIYEILQASRDEGVKVTGTDADPIHMVTHQILEAPVQVFGHTYTLERQLRHMTHVYRHYCPYLRQDSSDMEVIQQIEANYRQLAHNSLCTLVRSQ